MTKRDNPTALSGLTDAATARGEKTAAQLPDNFKARIVGKVQHRVGDGPLSDIPVGLEAHTSTAIASYVMSWSSEGQPVTVALAKDEFAHYLGAGDIVIVH